MPISFRLASYLFTALILFTLGFLVLTNNNKNRGNRVFAAFAFGIISWILSLAFADNSSSLAVVDLASRFAFVTASLSMLIILYFAAVLSGRKRTRLWWLWLVPVIISILTAPTKLAIASVSIQYYGANVVGGPIYTFFSVYAPIYLITAVVLLMRSMRRASGSQKIQLRFLAYGLATSTVIALVTNLLFVSLGYVGPASFLIFASLAAYAMIRHHLYDIRRVVARSIMYLLLLSTLTGLYGIGMLALSNIFFPDRGITYAEAVLFIGLALILAVTYQPLRRFFAKITDRLFFRDRYDSQALLDATSNTMATEILLEPLLAKCLKGICGPMHLARGQFLVLEGDKIYKEAHIGPESRPPITLEVARKLHHPIVSIDDLEPGPTKRLLEFYDIRVSLMLRAQGELVGYLFLGDKLSGETYSDDDLAILEIMRKELAIAIANAKAFEEIAQFNVTLQQRIRKATQRLSLANRNLKVLDKAKDDFISMASHQLGSPLTAINGFLAMTIDEDKHNLTKNQREYITYAIESTGRLVSMSSDMLNVSRLNSGRFLIQRQPVNLSQLVKQEVAQLRPACERKGLKLTYEPPADFPDINLDESKTRQVIMNFIDNAIYYTETGGIDVELKLSGGKAVLTVTDTGMGVPPDEQAKLFTKFYRAENAKTARPDGTGLGLYLAKRVIEEQGGAIIFATQEGKGSTFGFSLGQA